MALNKKVSIIKLLKGIESGDPESVLVVNEAKYIQHNPQTHEGCEGLSDLFKRLSKTSHMLISLEYLKMVILFMQSMILQRIISSYPYVKGIKIKFIPPSLIFIDLKKKK